ncbi:response regulator [Archangium violaceum]|uniref:response regulator n=1 Tax=Archangium violaceum TaxID=83451 RepID=UPI00194E0E63|nr:response regulator [Archangium violaceum]QRN93721.1 response regulator [Archangium violaceum]
MFQGQVLVIENLRERRQLLCDMLSQERFEVGAVEDARDAVQLLSQGLFSGKGKMPELIICNVRMLGDAGLEALAWLSARHPEIPVILLSAFTTPKMRERLARIDGAYVLDQFFDVEDVRSAAVSLAASRQTTV